MHDIYTGSFATLTSIESAAYLTKEDGAPALKIDAPLYEVYSTLRNGAVSGYLGGGLSFSGEIGFLQGEDSSTTAELESIVIGSDYWKPQPLDTLKVRAVDLELDPTLVEKFFDSGILSLRISPSGTDRLPIDLTKLAQVPPGCAQFGEGEMTVEMNLMSDFYGKSPRVARGGSGDLLVMSLSFDKPVTLPVTERVVAGMQALLEACTPLKQGYIVNTALRVQDANLDELLYMDWWAESIIQPPCSLKYTKGDHNSRQRGLTRVNGTLSLDSVGGLPTLASWGNVVLELPHVMSAISSHNRGLFQSSESTLISLAIAIEHLVAWQTPSIKGRKVQQVFGPIEQQLGKLGDARRMADLAWSTYTFLKHEAGSQDSRHDAISRFDSSALDDASDFLLATLMAGVLAQIGAPIPSHISLALDPPEEASYFGFWKAAHERYDNRVEE